MLIMKTANQATPKHKTQAKSTINQDQKAQDDKQYIRERRGADIKIADNTTIDTQSPKLTLRATIL